MLTFDSSAILQQSDISFTATNEVSLVSSKDITSIPNKGISSIPSKEKCLPSTEMRPSAEL